MSLLLLNHAAALGIAALLNTLWYAAAVVGLTWVVLRLAPEINAATRYWIWTGVLVFLLAVPFLPGVIARARTAFAARTSTAAVAEPLATIPTPGAGLPRFAPVTLTVNGTGRSNPWPLWLLAAWILGAAWETTRLVLGIASVQRLKARACSAAFVFERCGFSPVAQPKAAGPNYGPCATKDVLRSGAIPGAEALPAHLRRGVRLLISAETASPVAVGYRCPAVLIPPEMLTRLDEGERGNVLLHELAHLVRYDDWMALVTHVFGALLILHPLAAIVLRQIEREREMACDDFVVARTGSARSYAESLARLYDLRWSSGSRLLAPGLLGRNCSLADRIESLLRRGRKFSARPSLASLGMTALLFAVLLGAGGLIPSWIAVAQTGATLSTKFEVASINTANPGERNSGLWFRRGWFRAENESLQRLIQFAYGLQPQQLKRLPSWAKSQRYTIEAKTPPGTPKLSAVGIMTLESGMLRSLLAERFKLKAHRATERLPVYEIVIAKHSPKIQPTRRRDSGWGIKTGNGLYSSSGGTLAQLAEYLSKRLGRTVVNKTGLNGRYDFSLRWSPWRNEPGISASEKAAGTSQGADPESSEPSIFTAFQQQLGLKLKAAKGPVEVLVVDHVEQPTPN